MIDRISRWLDFGTYQQVANVVAVMLIVLLLLALEVYRRHCAMRRFGESSRGWRAWIARAWRYQRALGTTIPPEARVDPDRFSEEEFPVFCRKCRYQLRGLTEGRCPECGMAFERGRLLVQEYAIEGGRPLFPRSRKVAKWCLVFGIGLYAVSQITPFILLKWVPVFGPPQYLYALLEMKLPAAASIFTGVGIHLWQWKQVKARSRAVLRAIDHGLTELRLSRSSDEAG
ncbi:MAG: hypothetical protein IH986_03255 [Planctomycetes bacterium]|nr:hypothetical protein [Planctomycetota bacterium]